MNLVMILIPFSAIQHGIPKYLAQAIMLLISMERFSVRISVEATIVTLNFHDFPQSLQVDAGIIS
jgi:uncharacterized membrane protein (DUF106 family)